MGTFWTVLIISLWRRKPSSVPSVKTAFVLLLLLCWEAWEGFASSWLEVLGKCQSLTSSSKELKSITIVLRITAQSQLNPATATAAASTFCVAPSRRGAWRPQDKRTFRTEESKGEGMGKAWNEYTGACKCHRSPVPPSPIPLSTQPPPCSDTPPHCPTPSQLTGTGGGRPLCRSLHRAASHECWGLHYARHHSSTSFCWYVHSTAGNLRLDGSVSVHLVL